MTEPTDAEIEQLYLEETGFDLNDSPAALLDFARAALAKWGQPAHAVEPYGQVTTHAKTGQQFFYRWPAPPYLDTASECVAVYVKQPAAQAAEPVSQPQKNAIRQAFDEGAEYSANEWRGRVETAQLELEVYRKAYQTLLEQVAKGVSIMRPPPLVISAPQPVEREPLTDGQIRAMLNKHPPEDVCGWSYRMGIDDAELHHGIKGGQHVE